MHTFVFFFCLAGFGFAVYSLGRNAERGRMDKEFKFLESRGFITIEKKFFDELTKALRENQDLHLLVAELGNRLDAELAKK